MFPGVALRSPSGRDLLVTKATSNWISPLSQKMSRESVASGVSMWRFAAKLKNAFERARSEIEKGFTQARQKMRESRQAG